MDAIEIEKYNSNFSPFMGRTDITAQEIVSILGVASRNNTKVFVDSENISNYNEEEIENFLSLNIYKYNKINPTGTDIMTINSYSFDTLTHNTEGIISEIKFKKN